MPAPIEGWVVRLKVVVEEAVAPAAVAAVAAHADLYPKRAHSARRARSALSDNRCT